MSSVSVSCCQPPAAAMAARRHIPAVPLKLKKRPDQARPACSITKWPSSSSACASVSAEKSRFRCSQRHCTTATLGSTKWCTVRSSMSGLGRKSASKIRISSPLAVRSPLSSAPALKPVRSLPVDVLDVQLGEAAAQLGDLALADLLGLVGRVVEHLHLEAVARVANAHHRVEQPLDHVHLVEQRQLHRHRRQVGEPPGGPRPPIAVPVVQVHQLRAVEPVDRQAEQDARGRGR